MSWPDDQAYNEAVQDPRLCFSDAELRLGAVATLPSGLPKVVSGNFASVYQIKCARRTWAVRCFRREITDQQLRYRAIDEYLQKVRLPYFVGFDFLRDGIRVGGRWYPVVKMEWVTGQSLDQYVKGHLDRPDVLHRLSRDWLVMTQALQRAQVAHGDLQNGNVLVVGGGLKLIDYDGMYVPALASRPSNERGHPDFQHPSRSDSDFGPELDRFSAWVVFSSLLALSVAPYLWEMLQAGGDKLLFSREDFADPERSAALAALRQSGDCLAGLADELTASLRTSPRHVRPLDALYVPHPPLHRGQGLPEWLREHVAPPAAPEPVPVESGLSSSERRGAEWLIDHLVESSSLVPVSFAGWLLLERLCALLVMLTALACMCAVALGMLSAGFASGVAGSTFLLILYVLTRRYRGLDIVRQRALSAALLETLRQRERDTRGAIEQVARKLTSEEAEHRKRRSVSQAKLIQIQKEGAAAVVAVRRDATAGITKLEGQQRKLMEQQSSELRAAESQANATIRRLENELAGLQAAEQAERVRALQTIQQEHVIAFLEGQWLALAHLRSIGTELKGRLQDGGVVTAAHVSEARVRGVYGIGDQRAKTLLEWRKSLERRARASAPNTLPAVEAQRIRARIALRERSLTSGIADHRRQLETTKRTVQDRYQAKLSQLDAEIASVREGTDQQLSQVRAKYRAEEQRVQAELRKMDEQHTAAGRVIEGKRASLERALFQARFGVAQQEREFRRFQTITFRKYICRIVGLRRAG